MSGEHIDPLQPFRHMIAGLNAIASETDLAFLMDAGRHRAMIRPVNAMLYELVEIWQRARAGDLLEGDTARALRLLSAQDKSQLVRIIVELALPTDEEAILPYRIELKRRKPSRRERAINETTRRVVTKQKKRDRERSVVRRIMSVRQSTGCTLDQAFRKVAKCEDIQGGGLLADYLPKQHRSVAAVRADYMAGMNWLRPIGSVQYRVGGIIGGRNANLYFGDLTKKGRRPRPK